MSIKETEYFYRDVKIAKWCFSTKEDIGLYINPNTEIALELE